MRGGEEPGWFRGFEKGLDRDEEGQLARSGDIGDEDPKKEGPRTGLRGGWGVSKDLEGAKNIGGEERGGCERGGFSAVSRRLQGRWRSASGPWSLNLARAW